VARVTLVPKTGLLPFLHRFPYYTTRNASWYQTALIVLVAVMFLVVFPPCLWGVTVRRAWGEKGVKV